MPAKSPSSKSRGCLASVSTESLAIRQTYLFWFLVLAVLHRKIYVTDNHFERFGRREVKRQERNKRVVFDLMGHQRSTRRGREVPAPAGRSPYSIHETGCSLFPTPCHVHLVHSRARGDLDRDTVRYLDACVCRSVAGWCLRKEMTRRGPFST